MFFNYKKYKYFYTADFETSTEAWCLEKARVWLWDICGYSISRKQYEHKNGTTIDTFMDVISKTHNCLFSFHNLGYDGIYILDWLLNNDFKFTKNDKLKNKEFTTIITPQGLHYAYQIKFENGNIVTINDSLKHNSQSVKRLAETYNLDIKKGDIDYDLFRPLNYEPTLEELDYIHNDTEIVYKVLEEDIKHGFTRFTESGNSRFFLKKTIKDYKNLLPELEDYEDNFVRRAYRGGFTYLNPKHFNKDLGKMISLDINSMYPAQMLHMPMPIGHGDFRDGCALDDKSSGDCYIQHLYASFKLKPNKIPMISKRGFNCFSTKDLYLYDSEFKTIELWLTKPDLELFFECYDVYNIKWINYVVYSSIKGIELKPEDIVDMTHDEIIEKDGKGSLFYDYIYPNRYEKEHSTGGKRDRAKKLQNIAYGTQATSKNGELYEPYLKDNKVSFKKYNGTPRKGGYIPISCFITAWSRYFLIKCILNNIERFVYCDTDSLYLLGHETPNLPIHNSLYGYFKIEHYIERAKFLGSKRYMYYGREPNKENKLCISCCGAPPSVVSQMNFDNFVPYDKEKGCGEFKGKITSHIISGGKHLIETTYRLIC